MSRVACLALPNCSDTSSNEVKETRVLGPPILTTLCDCQRVHLVDSEDGYVSFSRVVSGSVLKLCKILRESELAQNPGALRRNRCYRGKYPQRQPARFTVIRSCPN